MKHYDTGSQLSSVDEDDNSSSLPLPLTTGTSDAAAVRGDTQAQLNTAVAAAGLHPLPRRYSPTPKYQTSTSQPGITCSSSVPGEIPSGSGPMASACTPQQQQPSVADPGAQEPYRPGITLSSSLGESPNGSGQMTSTFTHQQQQPGVAERGALEPYRPGDSAVERPLSVSPDSAAILLAQRQQQLQRQRGGDGSSGSGGTTLKHRASLPVSSLAAPSFAQFRRRTSVQPDMAAAHPHTLGSGGGLLAKFHRSSTVETSKVERDETDSQEVVNQYRILRELGKGAYGVVYEAQATVSGEKYAIKTLSKARLTKISRKKQFSTRPRGPPNRCKSGAPVPIAPDPLLQVKREIAILKSLDHPNIINLHEVIDDQNEDQLYMVFELMSSGCVMDDELDDKLDEVTSRSYFIDLMLGVEYLHAQNIAHRDIKPQNLLLDDTRQHIKITDFGVSEWFDDAEGSKTSAAGEGSPAFMAPEMFSKRERGVKLEVDAKKVDIWAMGVTLFCFLFGKLPFLSESILEVHRLIVEEEPDYPAECSEVSSEAREFLSRLLEKDPAKRISLADMRSHPWMQELALPTVEENCDGINDITEDEIAAAFTSLSLEDLQVLVDLVYESSHSAAAAVAAANTSAGTATLDGAGAGGGGVSSWQIPDNDTDTACQYLERNGEGNHTTTTIDGAATKTHPTAGTDLHQASLYSAAKQQTYAPPNAATLLSVRSLVSESLDLPDISEEQEQILERLAMPRRPSFTPSLWTNSRQSSCSPSKSVGGTPLSRGTSPSALSEGAVRVSTSSRRSSPWLVAADEDKGMSASASSPSPVADARDGGTCREEVLQDSGGPEFVDTVRSVALPVAMGKGTAGDVATDNVVQGHNNADDDHDHNGVIGEHTQPAADIDVTHSHAPPTTPLSSSARHDNDSAMSVDIERVIGACQRLSTIIISTSTSSTTSSMDNDEGEDNVMGSSCGSGGRHEPNVVMSLDNKKGDEDDVMGSSSSCGDGRQEPRVVMPSDGVVLRRERLRRSVGNAEMDSTDGGDDSQERMRVQQQPEQQHGEGENECVSTSVATEPLNNAAAAVDHDDDGLHTESPFYSCMSSSTGDVITTSNDTHVTNTDDVIATCSTRIVEAQDDVVSAESSTAHVADTDGSCTTHSAHSEDTDVMTAVTSGHVTCAEQCDEDMPPRPPTPTEFLHDANGDDEWTAMVDSKHDERRERQLPVAPDTVVDRFFRWMSEQAASMM